MCRSIYCISTYGSIRLPYSATFLVCPSIRALARFFPLRTCADMSYIYVLIHISLSARLPLSARRYASSRACPYASSRICRISTYGSTRLPYSATFLVCPSILAPARFFPLRIFADMSYIYVLTSPAASFVRVARGIREGSCGK